MIRQSLHQFMIRLSKGEYPHLGRKSGASVLDAINIHRLGIENQPIAMIRDRLSKENR